MKTYDIINAKGTLEKLSAMDLPLPAAIKLSKNVVEVNEVFKMFEEKRQALFVAYGEADEDTGNTNIKEENMDTFQKELNEMLFSDIDIDVKTLDVESLSNDIKLSANELNSVSWLFKDM